MGEKKVMKRYAVEISEEDARVLKLFYPSVKEALEAAVQEWMDSHEEEVKTIKSALEKVKKSKKQK